MLTLYLVIIIGGCIVACTLFFFELQKEKSKHLSLTGNLLSENRQEGQVKRPEDISPHIETPNNSKLSELQVRCEKLEILLKEKTEELEKSRAALETGLRSTEEFQKVKTILENELVNIRNENRTLKQELSMIKLDTENYQKHITSLKEELNTQASQKI